jgi:hypothetical protein
LFYRAPPEVIFFLIVLAAGLVTASAKLSSMASLEVSRVLSGEVWRLFSGHLSHLTWRQFILDAPVFIFSYQTFSNLKSKANAVLLLLFSSFLISVAVIFTGLHDVYGGLSGLSCAAISAILLVLVTNAPYKVKNYVFLAMFFFYLAFMKGITTDIPIAWESHLAGAFSGAVFVLMQFGLKKNN